MKKFRKIFGKGISTMLLLIFSVMVLPFDLLHNHAQQAVCKSTSAEGSTCKHKLHLKTKSGLCLLCGIHQDKTFIPPAATGITYLPVYTADFVVHSTHLVLSASSLDRLRGPPSTQVSFS